MSWHELEQHLAWGSLQHETTACSTAQHYGDEQHSQQYTPVFSEADLLDLFTGPADDSHGCIVDDFSD